MPKKKTKKTEPNKFEGSKKIPIGVQIISIFYYVFAGFCILSGFFSIVLASTVVTVMVNDNPDLAGVLTREMVITMGVFLMAFSVVYILVGMGLWKLKQWAKIIALILSGFGIIITSYSMATNFAPIQLARFGVNVIIGAYLLFFKEAKGVFK